MQCHACGQDARFRCEGCATAVYCGKACQKSHFAVHGPVCVPPESESESESESASDPRALVFDVDGTLTPFAGNHMHSLFSAYVGGMTARAIREFSGPRAMSVARAAAVLKGDGTNTLFGAEWGAPLPHDDSGARFNKALVRKLYAHVDALADAPRRIRLDGHVLGVYILSEDPFNWGMDIVSAWVDEEYAGGQKDILIPWLWDLYKRVEPRKLSVVSNSWRASVVYMFEYMAVDDVFNLSAEADASTGSLGSVFRTYERYITDAVPAAKMSMVRSKGRHWLDPTPATSKTNAGKWRLTPGADGRVPLLHQAERMGITSIIYVDDSDDDIENMRAMAAAIDEGPRFDLVKLYASPAAPKLPQWTGSDTLVGEWIMEVFDAPTQERVEVHELDRIKPRIGNEGYTRSARRAVWTVRELAGMGIDVDNTTDA